MKKKVILRLLAGMAFTAILTSCDKPKRSDAPAPPTVAVAPVREQTVQDYYVFTGRTEAVQTVDVRARVSGYLTETRFKDGQDVRKGDVLFVIDRRPYQADVDRAKAELDRAQAELQLAGIEFNRAKELRNRNTISAQDFDAKSAAYLKAQATFASAKAHFDMANLNLEFTTITSPIDGQASRASITPGNLVTPDLAKPLTVIVSTDPIYAYADVDERKLLGYLRQLGNAEGASSEKTNNADFPIYLQLADEKGFPHEGIVDFSENRVNRETGTITIRGIFEDKSKVLVPGMFVRLRIPSGPKQQNALLVPERAVAVDQGQKFVLTVSADGVVAYRRVKTGALQPDGWVVVTGDLKPGEMVVVEGLIKARPGEKVTSQPWTEAGALAEESK